MKKGLIVVGAALLSLSLVACGANNNNANDNNQSQGRQTEQAKTSSVKKENNNRRLSVSDRAEKQVEKLEEVDAARVIISNNDAYVAIRMSNKDTGIQGNNGHNGQNNNGNNNRNENGFFENGTVNQDRNNAGLENGIIDGKGDAGNKENNQNNNNTNGNTGNDNHTSRSTNYSPVNTAFEQQIADQVRQADNRIHKVYVSFDPDLYNRMNTYSDDIRNNRNQNNMFDDFTNTVEEFFRR